MNAIRSDEELGNLHSLYVCLLYTSFIELQDSKGRIQVYITRDDICPGEDKDLYNTVFKLSLIHI